MQDKKASIASLFPSMEIYEDFDLSGASSFKIGGKARFAAFPKSADEASNLIKHARENGFRTLFIGNGSNILFDSGYIDALIIFTSKMSSVFSDGEKLTADCGASLSSLCASARENSLSGLEFAYGIPGTLGGAVYMNAGAYGGEMADIVESVSALRLSDLTEIIFTKEELAFSYRHSVFSGGGYLILSSTLLLKSGNRSEISQKMSELMQKRRDKQPLEFPSAGSTFKRPVGAFAAELIEKAGLKGSRVGGAEVSKKHAGFIINRGGATSDDVLALIEKVKRTVNERFGIILETEVVYIK